MLCFVSSGDRGLKGAHDYPPSQCSSGKLGHSPYEHQPVVRHRGSPVGINNHPVALRLSSCLTQLAIPCSTVYNRDKQLQGGLLFLPQHCGHEELIFGLSVRCF